MHQIIIDDIIIDVVRKNIKNLHLNVYPPDGRVRIASPYRVNDEELRLFAISKLGWIKKHQQKFINQKPHPEKKYVSGESHYLWGQCYLLNLIYHPGYPKVIIRNEGLIDLYVKENYAISQREKVINNWYREKLKEELPRLIEKWQKIAGVEAAHWKVKKMKTRWGTCNREARRIWLSLELAKRPKHCLEYIIVHELVHFLERNHTSRFTAYMDKFMPFWRGIKEEMNRSGIKHEE